MSTWNLGLNDVSDETRSFRDKLASKESQIASQDAKLLKQAADLEELQGRLNEALHRLSSEATRASELEADLRRKSDDLQHEKIASDNARNALSNALEKQNDRTREIRDLENTLDRLSRTSDEQQAYRLRVEKEKNALEARVKELERQPQTQPSPVFPSGRRIPKPRSSSLSNIRINTLEQDLTGLRSQLENKGTEVESVTQKLTRALQDRNKAENERIASERKWQSQIETLQAALDDKEEELAFLKGDDGSREDELLKRIEEDDAKIAALEHLLRDSGDSKELKEKQRRLEIQLNEERQKRNQVEDRCLELASQLEETRKEAADLAAALEERQIRDDEFEERANRSLQVCDGSVPNNSQQHDTISHLEKLLVAVDRLRVERDGLRRDLAFLESESRFTIEALERKLACSSASVYSDIDPTVKTLDQMKHEMDELHSYLKETTENCNAKLHVKNNEICRLGLCLEGLAVAFGRVASSQQQATSTVSFEDQDYAQLEEKYEVTVLCLEAMTSQRDNLLVELQAKEEGETELRFTRQDVDELQNAVDELNSHIDHVESERDSLSLQVTNLTSDLQSAQDELANAESRYSNLQFHQLSNMPSNQATRTLRDHIEELEARVVRRTEQIGIHQHDIRRLETNLRLQEERLSEMMTELELMAAQKDAMVEDCADAREARDEALARIEVLEEEIEACSENERLVIDLIAVIVDTTARGRKAVHDTKESGRLREETLQTTVATLENQIDDIHQIHDVEVRDLLQQQEKLEAHLKDCEETYISPESNEELVTALKQQHAETIALLEQRLLNSESTVKDLQIRHKSAEMDHQIALEDAVTLIKELEQQLESTKKSLEELQELQTKFQLSEQKYTERISELEKEIEQVTEDSRNALQANEAMQQEKRELQDTLKRVEDDHKRIIEDARDEDLRSRHSLEQKLQTLQLEVDDNLRLLDMAKAEVDLLTLRLQDETERRNLDQGEYDRTLQSMSKQSEILNEQVLEVRRELINVQNKLQVTEAQVKSLDDDKMSLQQDMTTLEAEIQKLKSINRYLESQGKESDHVILTLKGDVDRLQMNLAHSEKTCKAAEVNLSLQNAQHKRESSELQREISTLRRIPNLESALRELEERNTEMEDLLRSKCAEIEENDDRVLEMLKEKKKLSSKVESLNRKVQNLQAKLAAAKASNAVQQPEDILVAASSNINQIAASIDGPASRRRAVTVAQTPSIPKLPQAPPERITTSHNSVQRMVSVPSSLPRPKTPERHRTPVFKARVPDRPEVDLGPENILIGKKRAAPDDFEGMENIPAHAFSADGKDVENQTPRVRRVLSSLQSSFTPNRNSVRPTIPLPSPKRPQLPIQSAHMSDMTNSPFALPPVSTSSAKPSKRSWLGKIRGTSQAVDKPSSNTRIFLGAGEYP